MKSLSLSLFTAVVLAASSAAAGTLPVDLGSAGNFTILAKSGISATGTTGIVGNIGVSPNSASSITGFGLIADASNQFSTSSLVTGKVYASNYAPPTPAIMTAAIGDMQTAYTDAAGRAAGVTELGAGNIGGMTLTPGVYKWSSGLTIPSNLTLVGGSSAVWIFQIAQTLDISGATQVILSGGAQDRNIFWQVGGQVTLGSTSVFHGNILGQTAIVLVTGATLNGKALAQTAVTLQANSVISSDTGGFLGNAPGKGKAFAYPSPARGSSVNVVYDMAGSGKATVRIWNDRGDLAATREELKLGGTQKTQLPIDSFSPGVYIFRVFRAYDSGVKDKTDVQKFTVAK